MQQYKSQFCIKINPLNFIIISSLAVMPKVIQHACHGGVITQCIKLYNIILLSKFGN